MGWALQPRRGGVSAQPTTLPGETPVGNVPPPVARTSVPLGIRIGIALMGAGVAFTVAAYTWGYFGLSLFVRNLVTFVRVQLALFIAESLLLNVGLFFVLRGVLRLLPKAGPWSWTGPILVLLGGLAVAAANATDYVLSWIFGFGVATSLEWLVTVLFIVLITGSAAVSLGLLLSLVGVVRGVLARRAGTVLPTRP